MKISGFYSLILAICVVLGSFCYGDAPNGVAISSDTIAENNTVGDVIGLITGSDPDPNSIFSYSLSGTDAAAFEIDGDKLLAGVVFDYEVKNQYNITITVKDEELLEYSEDFQIVITNLPEAPTGLLLDSNSIDENQPSGTEVGTLSAIDEDINETFAYQLTGGDMASFAIEGDKLKSAIIFDYEQKNSYTIEVTVTDSDSLTFIRQFAIDINNVNEAPVIDQGTTVAVDVSCAVSYSDTLTASDPEGNIEGWEIREGDEPKNGIASLDPVNPGMFTYISNDGYSGTDSFKITVVDEDGLSCTITINVNVRSVGISNAANFANIGSGPLFPRNGSYLLEKNIDMSGVNMPALGSSANPFTGTFEGNGKIIKNLTIADQGQFCGLFGMIQGGAVRNLILENPKIEISGNTNYIGLFAGFNYGGTIERCGVKGDISVVINDPDITDNIGVMVYAGLFAGSNYRGTINQCYASGNLDITVNGENCMVFCGGFVGYNWANGAISDSYAYSDISLTTNGNPSVLSVGGFAGENYGTITNCYARSAAPLQERICGFTAVNFGQITGCYCDSLQEVSPVYLGSGDGVSPAELVGMTIPDGWDTSIWATLPDSSLIFHSQYLGCDNNLDGNVDFVDYARFAEAYSISQIDADVNNDGFIDYNDIGFFAAQWLENRNPANVFDLN